MAVAPSRQRSGIEHDTTTTLIWSQTPLRHLVAVDWRSLSIGRVAERRGRGAEKGGERERERVGWGVGGGRELKQNPKKFDTVSWTIFLATQVELLSGARHSIYWADPSL